MKRGNVTLKILETVGVTAAFTVIGLCEALISIAGSNYGASYGKMKNNYLKGGFEVKNSVSDEKIIKRRYKNVIYKLKKNGLIEEKNKRDKKVLILTELGKKKLLFLKKRQKVNLPEISQFKKEEGDKFVIIIFDIPESERRKRDWVREVLKNIGLKMIQKSVWIGKVKIPKEFVSKLRDLKLLNFVEIFEISKGGSLKDVR